MQTNEWKTGEAQDVSVQHDDLVSSEPSPLVGPHNSPVVSDLGVQILPPKKASRRKVRPAAVFVSIFRMLTANPKMIIGTSILLFFFLVAIFGPLLYLNQDPNKFTNDLFQTPSASHWLGTSSKGEDIFFQLIAGARVSLTIGFVSAIGATILSVVIGLSAGYFGGIVDDVLSLLINVFLVIPSLPLAIVLASFGPKGPSTILLVLLFTTWAWGARVLRSQTLSMRHRDFVEAARAVGETPLRIIFAEILPNEIAIAASSFVTTFIYTILTEVALEFLGLGNVLGNSWGVMLFWAQNDQALLTGGWWLFLPPGICIALLGAGLAFMNYGIDELANPRLRKERVRRRAKEVVA